MRGKEITGNYKLWYVTQTRLAEILGISQARVNQLIEEGVVVKAEKGVLLIDSLKNYWTKTRQPTNLLKEKTLHERAKRELTELKLRQRQGELYEAAAVRQLLVEIITNFRNKLSGFSAKLTPQLVMKNHADIYTITSEEIDDLIDELAKTFEEIEFNETDEGIEGGDEQGSAG